MYKIIKDNYIIDVSNTYLAENARNHALVNTTQDNAHFLLGLNGTTLYKTKWCYGHVLSKYNAIEVEAQPITPEEFESLKQQLQTGVVEEVKELPQETQVVELKDEPKTVLDSTALQQKIIELEALVQQLLKK